MRHLNLLPPERRIHLRRRVIIAAVNRIMRAIMNGLIVMTVAGVLVSVSMWVYGLFVSRSTNVELSEQVRVYAEWKEGISEQNDLLDSINAVGSERIVWSEVMSGLIKSVPPRTIIEEIIGDASKSSLQFSGRALNRNALVVFEERLSDLIWVSEVIAPRSNLLQKDSPEFSFELIINETKFKGQ